MTPLAAVQARIARLTESLLHPAPPRARAPVRRGDWSLARYCSKYAVLARVASLLDEGQPVDVSELPRSPGERCA